MEPRTAIRAGSAAYTTWSVVRLARLVFLAPVFSLGSALTGLFWLFVPGVVARAVWRQAHRPGTLLFRLRVRAAIAAARSARRRFL